MLDQLASVAAFQRLPDIRRLTITDRQRPVSNSGLPPSKKLEFPILVVHPCKDSLA